MTKGCSAFLACCLWVFIPLAMLSLPPDSAQAEVSSEPSGFIRVDLLGNSDTIVSLPFLRAEAAAGLVASYASGNITITGAPGWAVNQFVYQAGVQNNTYFVWIRSGVKEGHYFGITSNSTDSVTVDLSGDDLIGILSGDRVSIMPYWTPGSLFPGGNSIHASPTPGSRNTEVFLLDLNFAGINLSARITYYFWSGKWRRTDKPFSQSFDNDPFLPDAFIIVRHNVATSTVLTLSGGLVMNKWAMLLNSNPASKQDNVVGLPRPVSVSLDNSGLISSGAFSPSPTPGTRTDEFFTFDNTVVSKNKSATHTFYYWNGAWRQTDKPFSFNSGTNEVFAPGTGVVIRKNINAATATWVNSPGY